MSRPIVLVILVLLSCACKPRRDRNSALRDVNQPQIQWMSTQVYSPDGQTMPVQIVKPTRGVWAFGKDPGYTQKLWPDPEGHELLKMGLYSWPKNWPMSPVGAIPYEKLFAFDRFRKHKQRTGSPVIYNDVVGADDFHFDCDDQALAYHRWCAFNAGRKCFSVMISHNDGKFVDSSSDPGLATVVIPIERKKNGEIETFSINESQLSKLDFKGNRLWLNTFLGTYNLIEGPAPATWARARLVRLEKGNRRTTYRRLHLNWKDEFNFHKYRNCKYKGENSYCQDVIRINGNNVEISQRVSSKEESWHVAVVHETENNKSSKPKYCLVEQVFFPQNPGYDTSLPRMYGCWEGSSSLPRGVLEDKALQRYNLTHANSIRYEQEQTIMYKPVHSEVKDQLTSQTFRVGFMGKKYNSVYNDFSKRIIDIKENEYSKSATTSFMFAYITGLHPSDLNPLTPEDMTNLGLTGNAISKYLTYGGAYDFSRQGIDAHASESNLAGTNGEFVDIKDQLMKLQFQGSFVK